YGLALCCHLLKLYALRVQFGWIDGGFARPPTRGDDRVIVRRDARPFHEAATGIIRAVVYVDGSVGCQPDNIFDVERSLSTAAVGVGIRAIDRDRRNGRSRAVAALVR